MKIKLLATRKAKFLFWIFFGIFIFICALTLWSSYLFRQLEIVTSQRALRRPAVFYSDITAIKPGIVLSPKKMISKLSVLGYSETYDTPSVEEFYYVVEENIIDVFFRSFIFPNGEEVSGPYRFYFSKNHLTKIESLPDLRKLEEMSLEPVAFGDTSGEGAENRPWIPLDKIPDKLKTGVLNSEDKRFYQHHGIDPRSLIRAFVVNFRKKGVHQGGSTLTQQLVKNAFLTNKRTLKRKITEAFLSLAMEIRYEKNEIFEMYLNQIYLGRNGSRGIYGVEDASLSYFGKHVSELSIGESALLIGLIPAPNKNSPRSSLERSFLRRDFVLNLLLKNLCITMQEYIDAKTEELSLAPLNYGTGSYYLTIVREILESDFSSTALDFYGLKIFTALDMDMQLNAESALASQPIEGAIIAMDPFTGFVKALSGGRNFRQSPFNRAIYAHRQPGSAFKPLIFAAAIESKAATMATIIDDSPLKMELNSGIWEPNNYDETFSGSVTVRNALIYSINIPAIKVLVRVGINQAIKTARALGIESELNAVPSLALGTSEVTPLELTNAYAPFANGGFAVKPLFIKTVSDSDNNILKEYTLSISPAISPETAYIMTDALRDVIEIGTGKNVRLLGFTGTCAGKTGTSDNFADAWFIGYTPSILCGVWLGHDKPVSLKKAAAHLALPVWTEFMINSGEGEQEKYFFENKNVLKISIDPANGLRARIGCTDKRKELFIKGTEPKEYCNLHQGGIPGMFKKFLGIFKKRLLKI